MRHRRPTTPPRPTVAIPYNFSPRSYQIPLLRYLETGGKRAFVTWHRRSGKDLLTLNRTIMCAVQRPGLYLMIYPDSVQGRRIAWDGMTNDGRPFLSYFPPEITLEVNQTEASVRTISANNQQSVWQILGSDQHDRIRGSNPVGVVLSEFAYMNPMVWQVLSPILAANQGWCIFATTPNGRGHAFELWKYAQHDPEWFTQLLTIEDTKRDAPGEDGEPVVSQASIDAERAEGRDEDWILQEFYCSWTGSRSGSYYGEQYRLAERDGRITRVAWDPILTTETWWDLGVGDHLVVWFVQHAGNEVRIIDYLEATAGEGMPYVAKELRAKPYTYSEHLLPHDAEAKEIGSGRSRVEIAEALGIRPTRTVARLSVDDGIQAVRAIFPRCYFDEQKCRKGLDALAAYKKEWDPVKRTFKDRPYHDFASHASDAFRTGAVGTEGGTSHTQREIKVEMEFDVRQPYFTRR
jgi:hypothetical protein